MPGKLDPSGTRTCCPFPAAAGFSSPKRAERQALPSDCPVPEATTRLVFTAGACLLWDHRTSLTPQKHLCLPPGAPSSVLRWEDLPCTSSMSSPWPAGHKLAAHFSHTALPVSTGHSGLTRHAFVFGAFSSLMTLEDRGETVISSPAGSLAGSHVL